MVRRPAITGLIAAGLAALACGATGTATASASPPAARSAPLGSLLQRSAVSPAFPAARCRAWRVQGQTWFASQSNGYTLMFTVRMATPPSSRISGYVQSSQSNGYRNQVGSQLIRGGLGTTSNGIVSIHLDIFWSNGGSGQYNGTAYDARPTSGGGLTASLHGTTVDTTGSGASARWVADGLDGPLGDTSRIRPLYCPARDVVR